MAYIVVDNSCQIGASIMTCLSMGAGLDRLSLDSGCLLLEGIYLLTSNRGVTCRCRICS